METLAELFVKRVSNNPESIRELITKTTGYLVANGPVEKRSQWLEDQSIQVLEQLDTLILNSFLERKDDNRRITFAVTAGAPGTGKGTNIASVNMVFSLLKEVSDTSDIALPSLLLPLVDTYTGKSSSIITGTGGITNMPAGEYESLFGDLSKLIKEEISKGGFAGDGLMTFCVKLMILLRLSEGAEKIQFDLWPRTEKQFYYYGELVQILRQNSISVNSEVTMLRLLDRQEITATLANKEEYIVKAHDISKTIKAKLKEPEYLAKVETVLDSADAEDLKIKKLSELNSEIVSSVKSEFTDGISNFVFLELQRALDRMLYRLTLTLQKGEIPRVDELPHIQLNRFTIFFGDTGPAFVKATDRHQIAMISSFQSPGIVVREILQSIAIKHENGAILAEMPELWHTIESVGAAIAEQIVKKEPITADEYKKQLADSLKKI